MRIRPRGRRLDRSTWRGRRRCRRSGRTGRDRRPRTRRQRRCERASRRQHRVQQRARPARRRDGIAVPRLTRRQRREAEPPVSRTFDRDCALDGRHATQVVQGQRHLALDRAEDLEAAVVRRQREVAPDEMHGRRRDIAAEGLGRRLSVERLRLDHHERGTLVGQIFGGSHVCLSVLVRAVSSPSRADQGAPLRTGSIFHVLPVSVTEATPATTAIPASHPPTTSVG